MEGSFAGMSGISRTQKTAGQNLPYLILSGSSFPIGFDSRWGQCPLVLDSAAV